MEKRSSAKKYIFYIVMLLVVALLVALPFLLGSAKQADEVKASILSGTAESGSVVSTVSGTGTLTEQDAVDITVPQGVEIRRFLVENGDFITAGTPVALVDKTSVMTTIASIKESMDTLEEEMNEEADSSLDSAVAAQSAGRVKAVYAQVGDNVQEVMLEHGALALVSLDGKMALQLQTSASLRPADSVIVTLSDGSEETGTVESSTGGTVVITLSDRTAMPGDEASVRTADGTALGSGTLYIHSEWKATAISGTIANVYASVGRQVYSMDVLFYLTDTEYTAQYELLASQHRDYEDMTERLFAMYETGYVVSEADGCVSGIDEDMATGLACAASEGAELNLLTLTSAQSASVSLLGFEEDLAELMEDDDGSGESEAKTGIAYGTVTTDQFGVRSLTISSVSGKTDLIAGQSYVLPSIAYTDTDGSEISLEDLSAGDTVMINFEEEDELAIPVSGKRLVKSSGSGGSGGFPGGGSADGTGTGGGMDVSGMSAGGTASVSTSAAATGSSLFSTTETVLMSVTPQDYVTITITVDELDVLSVTEGEEAEITIDALPSQRFTGTVTKLNRSASNNGGSSKFTAEVKMDRTLNMLGGMNASVLITNDSSENTVTVPAEVSVP